MNVKNKEKKEDYIIEPMFNYLKQKGVDFNNKYFPKEKLEKLKTAIKKQKDTVEYYDIDYSPSKKEKSNSFLKKKNDVFFRFKITKGESKDEKKMVFVSVELFNKTTKHHLSLNSKVGKQINVNQAVNLLSGKTVGVENYAYKSPSSDKEIKKSFWIKLEPKKSFSDKNDFIFKSDEHIGIFGEKVFKEKDIKLNEEQIKSLSEGDGVKVGKEFLNVNLSELNKRESEEKKMNKGRKL